MGEIKLVDVTVTYSSTTGSYGVQSEEGGFKYDREKGKKQMAEEPWESTMCEKSEEENEMGVFKKGM